MVTDDNHDGSASLRPMCDEEEFVELMMEMVAEEAPRLFALVQELGERADGRIAAWGLAFEDGPAEVVGVVPGTRMTLRSPESAVRRFSAGEHVRARLVWV
jgi:hypothetical protein